MHRIFSQSIHITKRQKIWNIIAMLGIMLLLYGFLFNRVVNNIGSFLIGLYAVVHLKDHIKVVFHPWMLSFLLISVIPILSDVLLEGRHFYQYRGDMKLLLLVYPIFFFVFKPRKEDLKHIMFIFMVTMLFSTCYSLYHYFIDFDNMFLTYKQSRVVKTLAKGDHIRISWATVVSCIMALYLIAHERYKYKYFIWLYLLIQIIFLHILGSKTGLLLLYITLGIYVLSAIIKINKWMVVAALLLIGMMPYVAYKTIPSFAQRVHFIKYDYEHYSQGIYRDGLSDAVRFYSLQAGWAIIKQYPWFGCGFSRLQAKTNEWFSTKMPLIQKENYFLPSSQFIIFWASGGIFCLAIFIYHLMYPFFDTRMRKNVWFLMFFVPAAISFTFETHLEGQFSLFLYGFFASYFWYLASEGGDKNISISTA